MVGNFLFKYFAPLIFFILVADGLSSRQTFFVGKSGLENAQFYINEFVLVACSRSQRIYILHGLVEAPLLEQTGCMACSHLGFQVAHFYFLRGRLRNQIIKNQNGLLIVVCLSLQLISLRCGRVTVCLGILQMSANLLNFVRIAFVV